MWNIFGYVDFIWWSIWEFKGNLFGSHYEGKFIRTWCLIASFISFGISFNDTSVAYSKKLEEFAKLSSLLNMSYITTLFLNRFLYLFNTTLAHAFLGNLFKLFRNTIDYAIDSNLFELHLVLSKSAGFVRENEFNLAHFFNQIRVSASWEITILSAIQVHILGDNRSLA